jgi:hypothetical protein
MNQQENSQLTASKQRTIPLSIKVIILLIFLYIGFADIIGDQFNQLYYQPPEAWLANTLGPDAIKNSLTLVVKDPWGQSVYSITSIKQDLVYIVWPRKNIFYVYDFKPMIIPVSSCKELLPLTHALRELIAGRPIDETIARRLVNKGELDGPTFTLKQFDQAGTATRQWELESLETSLARDIDEVAQACYYDKN